MRAANCGRLTSRPLTGTWFRALRLKHWATRLSSDHSRFSTSRFSAATQTMPLFRIVSLAANHQVALHEARALLGNPNSPVSNTQGSWVVLSLEVLLDNVVDLTVASEQRLISTNHAELTGNWLNFPGVAPTQELGEALYRRPGVEGFIYPSSLVNEVCLGVFPDKFGARSSIRFRNEMRRNSPAEGLV